jgi:hypothetical protein
MPHVLLIWGTKQFFLYTLSDQFGFLCWSIHLAQRPTNDKHNRLERAYLISFVQTRTQYQNYSSRSGRKGLLGCNWNFLTCLWSKAVLKRQFNVLILLWCIVVLVQMAARGTALFANTAFPFASSFDIFISFPHHYWSVLCLIQYCRQFEIA